MASIDEKRMTFLVATKFFEERFGEEIKSGMSDEWLKSCLVQCLSFRLVWGGPGKWSGRCDPQNLKIWAGPSPLEEFEHPVLRGYEILKLARLEYGITDPEATQGEFF